MDSSAGKREKTEAKRAKKSAKLELKAAKAGRPRGGPATTPEPVASPAVRYAEYVRGILSVVLGASIVVALVLGQRGAIVSLDDIIDSLFAARVGKVLLVLIGAALLIYGLKHLRVVR